MRYFLIAALLILAGCATSNKINRANWLIKTGDYVEALKIYENLQEENPDRGFSEDIEYCKKMIDIVNKGNIENLKNLEVGQSKSDVLKILGEPKRREISRGVEILMYEMHDDNSTTPYRITFQDEKLTGYSIDQDEVRAQRELAELALEKKRQNAYEWGQAAEMMNQYNQQQHNQRMQEMQMRQRAPVIIDRNPKQVNCTTTPGVAGTSQTNCNY